MVNFKQYILTYSGEYIKYSPKDSTNTLKVYKLRDYVVTVCYSKINNEYTIEVKRNASKQYFTVKSRRGVYAALTYFEPLQNPEEVDFILNQYGSLQHYFDNVCCTPEYIKEHYKMR